MHGLVIYFEAGERSVGCLATWESKELCGMLGPAVVFLGTYPADMLSCSTACVTRLSHFSVVCNSRHQKQPKFPSGKGRLNKLRYVHLMEYSTVVRLHQGALVFKRLLLSRTGLVQHWSMLPFV